MLCQIKTSYIAGDVHIYGCYVSTDQCKFKRKDGEEHRFKHNLELSTKSIKNNIMTRFYLLVLKHISLCLRNYHVYIVVEITAKH